MNGVSSQVETMLAVATNGWCAFRSISVEGGGRSKGIDMRCVLEVFMEGQSPVLSTEQEDTVNDAVRGAAHRLEPVTERQLGRLSRVTPTALPFGVAGPARDLTERRDQRG